MHPPVDVTLPMALKVLAGFPDPKVDETAAAAIEGLLGQERLPYWIDQALGVSPRGGSRPTRDTPCPPRGRGCSTREPSRPTRGGSHPT